MNSTHLLHNPQTCTFCGALLRAIQQYLGAYKPSQKLVYVLFETKSKDKSEETSVLTSHAVEKGEETMPTDWLGSTEDQKQATTRRASGSV